MANYVLENGKGGYITLINNSYTLTGNINKAKIFTDYQKAVNVCKSLPRTITRNQNDSFTVKALDCDTETEFVVSNKEAKCDENMVMIKTMLNDLNVFSQNIIAQEEEYRNRLSELDKELSDIDHYIEFYPLSAYDGYRMSRMRKDRLEERRRIKNGLTEIGIIKSLKGDDALNGLKRIETQQYTPRILIDMFEEKEKRRIK